MLQYLNEFLKNDFLQAESGTYVKLSISACLLSIQYNIGIHEIKVSEILWKRQRFWENVQNLQYCTLGQELRNVVSRRSSRRRRGTAAFCDSGSRLWLTRPRGSGVASSRTRRPCWSPNWQIPDRQNPHMGCRRGIRSCLRIRVSACSSRSRRQAAAARLPSGDSRHGYRLRQMWRTVLWGRCCAGTRRTSPSAGHQVSRNRVDTRSPCRGWSSA